MWKKVLLFGLILSFVGLIPFVLLYVFDWKASWMWLVKIFASVTIIGFFIKELLESGDEIRSLQGFIFFYLSVISVLFISSIINLSAEYIVYNQLDKSYVYKIEERSYNAVSNRRIEKGLPVPNPKSDLEIKEKYGFWGLLKIKQPGYVINFIFAFFFYPIAILMFSLRENMSSGNVKMVKD